MVGDAGKRACFSVLGDFLKELEKFFTKPTITRNGESGERSSARSGERQIIHHFCSDRSVQNFPDPVCINEVARAEGMSHGDIGKVETI